MTKPRSRGFLQICHNKKLWEIYIAAPKENTWSSWNRKLLKICELRSTMWHNQVPPRYPPKKMASAQAHHPHPPHFRHEAKSCRARGSKGCASMVSVISPHPSVSSSRSLSPKPRCFCRCSWDLPCMVPLIRSKECNKDAQTLEKCGKIDPDSTKWWMKKWEN